MPTIFSKMNNQASAIVTAISNSDAEAFRVAEAMACAYFYPNVELDEPYKTDFASQPPTREDIDAIKDALLSYLESNARGEHVGVAFFALGKINDDRLVAPLRAHLAQQVRIMLSCNGALGNLICALDNIREPVLRGQLFSAAQVTENLDHARHYLLKNGIDWRE